jgi:hypothetical protein
MSAKPNCKEKWQTRYAIRVVEQQAQDLPEKFNSELQVTRRHIGMTLQDIEVTQRDILDTSGDRDAFGINGGSNETWRWRKSREKYRQGETTDASLIHVLDNIPPQVRGRPSSNEWTPLGRSRICSPYCRDNQPTSHTVSQLERHTKILLGL